MKRVQLKEERVKDVQIQLVRDDTHTLVFRECLERDMGELYGIWRTENKQKTQH